MRKWENKPVGWVCGCVSVTALEKKVSSSLSHMSPVVTSGAWITLVSLVSCVCVLCSDPHGNVSSPLIFTIRVNVPELCPKQGAYTWSHLTFLSLTSVSLSTQKLSGHLEVLGAPDHLCVLAALSGTARFGEQGAKPLSTAHRPSIPLLIHSNTPPRPQ